MKVWESDGNMWRIALGFGQFWAVLWHGKRLAWTQFCWTIWRLQFGFGWSIRGRSLHGFWEWAPKGYTWGRS